MALSLLPQLPDLLDLNQLQEQYMNMLVLAYSDNHHDFKTEFRHNIVSYMPRINELSGLISDDNISKYINNEKLKYYKNEDNALDHYLKIEKIGAMKPLEQIAFSALQISPQPQLLEFLLYTYNCNAISTLDPSYYLCIDMKSKVSTYEILYRLNMSLCTNIATTYDPLDSHGSKLDVDTANVLHHNNNLDFLQLTNGIISDDEQGNQYIPKMFMSVYEQFIDKDINLHVNVNGYEFILPKTYATNIAKTSNMNKYVSQLNTYVQGDIMYVFQKNDDLEYILKLIDNFSNHKIINEFKYDCKPQASSRHNGGAKYNSPSQTRRHQRILHNGEQYQPKTETQSNQTKNCIKFTKTDFTTKYGFKSGCKILEYIYNNYDFVKYKKNTTLTPEISESLATNNTNIVSYLNGLAKNILSNIEQYRGSTPVDLSINNLEHVLINLKYNAKRLGDSYQSLYCKKLNRYLSDYKDNKYVFYSEDRLAILNALAFGCQHVMTYAFGQFIYFDRTNINYNIDDTIEAYIRSTNQQLIVNRQGQSQSGGSFSNHDSAFGSEDGEEPISPPKTQRRTLQEPKISQNSNTTTNLLEPKTILNKIIEGIINNCEPTFDMNQIFTIQIPDEIPDGIKKQYRDASVEYHNEVKTYLETVKESLTLSNTTSSRKIKQTQQPTQKQTTGVTSSQQTKKIQSPPTIDNFNIDQYTKIKIVDRVFTDIDTNLYQAFCFDPSGFVKKHFNVYSDEEIADFKIRIATEFQNDNNIILIETLMRRLGIPRPVIKKNSRARSLPTFRRTRTQTRSNTTTGKTKPRTLRKGRTQLTPGTGRKAHSAP
jgi:hypothetical protein